MMRLSRFGRKSPPPLIKWTGSKRTQAKAIATLMPPHERYIEPFLGGGSVLYFATAPVTLASDIYAPLMELWQLFQQTPQSVIDNYRGQWTLLNEELAAMNPNERGRGKPRYYYTVRERFNQTANPLDLNFLLRTCVNGIVRFNGEGKFNNSFHLSRRGITPDNFRRVVNVWHPRLAKVEFGCQDYITALRDAREGDFVYLDPPYAGNRQRYSKNLDVDKFLAVLADLNRKNVKWALSFDGWRGMHNLEFEIPTELFIHKISVPSGNSAVRKVLRGSIEPVHETLYLNYSPSLIETPYFCGSMPMM